jgi:hypothetical protein
MPREQIRNIFSSHPTTLLHRSGSHVISHFPKYYTVWWRNIVGHQRRDKKHIIDKQVVVGYALDASLLVDSCLSLFPLHDQTTNDKRQSNRENRTPNRSEPLPLRPLLLCEP